MRRKTLSLAALLLAAVASQAGRPCSGISDFAGEVILGSIAAGQVELDWQAWEDSRVATYVVTRSPAGCRGKSCAETIARLAGGGLAAPALRGYQVLDVAPPGDWTYRVELLARLGPACGAETQVYVPDVRSCGTADLCAQAAASFASSPVTMAAAPAVALEWLVSAEDPQASLYRVTRSGCGDAACAVEVATFPVLGSCGELRPYRFVESPAAGNWTYTLAILDASGRTSCTVTTRALVGR